MKNQENEVSEQVIEYFSKRRSIPKEAFKEIINLVLDLFHSSSEALLLRSLIFSRWCLAGSLTGTFTVLMSLSDLKNAYEPIYIGMFLVFQILSIVFGLWFLFSNEITNALSESFQSKETFFKAKIDSLIEIHGDWRKDQNTEQDFYNSMIKTAKKIIGKTWEAKLLFIQIMFLMLGLIILTIGAFKALN